MKSMEKTMSVEEKIRRAEEIYNKRNGNNYSYRYNMKEKKSPSLMRRMIKQIIMCFIIYGVFYVVSNREYFLSSEFQDRVEQVASKNEILENGYIWIKGYLDKYIKSDEIKDETNEESKDDNKQTPGEENGEGTEEQTSSIQVEEVVETNKNSDSNIGGASEEIAESTEKSQEEKDAEEIKNTISFITPVDGTISSTFGWRTPTTSTVPKYHTGLDIAATTGTVIKSATDGKVILVSSQGDYGMHYKIQINDVIIIYAHCSKLYLNEGDELKQGQSIAEVGSTGNSTRATFAF